MGVDSSSMSGAQARRKQSDKSVGQYGVSGRAGQKHSYLLGPGSAPEPPTAKTYRRFPSLCACECAIPECPRHGVEVGGLVAHDEGDGGAARRHCGPPIAQEPVERLDIHRRIRRSTGVPHVS